MYSLILLSNKIKCTIDRLNKINEFQKYYGEFTMYDSLRSHKKQAKVIYSDGNRAVDACR